MTDRFLLPAIAQNIIDDSHILTHPDCPFKARLYPGDPRMVVVVGANASGKSLLFRMIAAIARAEHKLTPITISIRERTGSGLHEMSAMRRMFMFGDETEQSTGATSVNVVKGGFHNAGRESPGILMLDEPEMGLSDGYATALGEWIGLQTLKEMREDCHGVVVVSHNRGLVRGLRHGLGVIPTFICMDEEPRDLNEWVAWPDVRTVEDLLRLNEVASERRKATFRIMGEK